MAPFLLLCCLFQCLVTVFGDGSCPDGWTKHSGSCYHFSHDRQEWTGAMDICKLMGGNLAEIESGNENYYLWNHVKTRNANWWIGLQDIVEEDQWQWINSLTYIGLNGAFTHWALNKPDNGGGRGENCVNLDNRNHGEWDDVGCTAQNYYICEMAVSRKK